MENKYWLGFTSSKFDPQLDRYMEPELSLARTIKRIVHDRLVNKDEDKQLTISLAVLYSIHSSRNMYLVYKPKNIDNPIRHEIYLHISITDKMLFALLPGCWTKVSLCLEPNCNNDGFKSCAHLLCEYHMNELKPTASLEDVDRFSRLCLGMSRCQYGNSQSLEDWDLYLEDKSDWIPLSLKIKQKLEQGIASVIELFSKRYMNNLELDNMHDNLYRRICGELKTGIHKHDDVLILSYCPERERILYKFVGDEDWGMICNYVTYKCLKPCVKGETLCKSHACLKNPIERVENSAKLGCKSDDFSSSAEGKHVKENDSYNLEIKIIQNSSKSFKIEFNNTL